MTNFDLESASKLNKTKPQRELHNYRLHKPTRGVQVTYQTSIIQQFPLKVEYLCLTLFLILFLSFPLTLLFNLFCSSSTCSTSGTNPTIHSSIIRTYQLVTHQICLSHAVRVTKSFVQSYTRSISSTTPPSTPGKPSRISNYKSTPTSEEVKARSSFYTSLD